MVGMTDWNANVISEFRENQGRVGGGFEGAPMLVLHHRGRKSGRDLEIPLVYLPDKQDADLIYIFATKGGAPTHPEWYHNLVAAGKAQIERGTESYPVTVAEVTGPDRDRIYGEQASRMANFAEYEEKTKGIRTIPVVALRRA
ncbi:deazaflavin-dependent oxidoreductase (nitroreductase family) [Nocardia sp. GAS34]